ncbi:MAG TPA: MFS transporter, partial [Thermoanaerobaculia bacterium]|nr:MFS transporter [Thermoanaerobaculia bacterium]
RETDYRRFWITQFISNIGSWMQTVAQGWLVYSLTDSAFLLGFVAFASSAPAALLMLPGGVVADQYDRKRVVAFSQVAQAGSALFLAVMTFAGRITVWQIVGAAIVVGIAQSFSAPAFQAMIADLLLDRSRLPNAIAMNSLQFNSSRVIGPLIAGAALTIWGAGPAFLLNALSFLPLTWVLMRIPNRQKPLEGRSAIHERLAEGFRFVLADKLVLLLLGVVGLGSLFSYPVINLMPVVARFTFANDAAGLGYLMAAVGVGALCGALALSMRTPGQERGLLLIVGALALNGAALMSVAAFRSRPAVLALLFVCGITMVVCMALCNTTIQSRLPDFLRGRVLSMYTFAFYASIPLGNLIAGAVAERGGIRRALVMLGSGVVSTGALSGYAMWVGRRRIRRSIRESLRPSTADT